LIGYTTEGIADPESFEIDPAGANLYVCNYADSSIAQLAIDPDTGALTLTGTSTPVPFPFDIAISA
jgi:6-phosphogluconolactonase (cycloisomerase 2 family)